MIKSVQKGSITFGNSDTSIDATVTSVDPSKAYIEFDGFNGFFIADCSVQLISATTVRGTRTQTGSGATIYFTLVEFN